jgi:GT2 family glycosyltransferase
MLLRRQAFLSVGGFDDSYFAYFDDADLCWRFWLAGYSVHYEPAARVLHAYGGSSQGGRLSTFRLEHCQTNRLQNMFKHLEFSTLVAMAPISTAYDLGRVLMLLRNGQGQAAGALIRGTRRFRVLLPHVLSERRRIQSTRVRSDQELIRLGAIASLRHARHEWRRLGGLTVNRPT